MFTIKELPKELQQCSTPRKLSTGQILFQQGDPTEFMFWVESGRLKLVSFTEEQMITYYTVGEGDSFAETAINADTYSCTVIAEQPSRVIGIPKHKFLEALHQSSNLCKQYVSHLSQRFESVKQLLELRSIRSARNRLLRYLTQQCQPGQSTIPLTTSLKVLATNLGLSPEVLSRTFNQLESEQILSRKKGSVTLLAEWLSS